MIQGRGRACFAAETFQSLWVSRELIGQELEGDEAAQFGVLGFINHAHAAAAKFLDYAVVGDSLADQVVAGVGFAS
jgi:hypothetical protein